MVSSTQPPKPVSRDLGQLEPAQTNQHMCDDIKGALPAKRNLKQDTDPQFSSVDFPLKAHQSPHGRITGVSMMKDEGPFVLEWVAHHLSLGFTDLIVYTNDCSDGTDDMLIRLAALGLVHHRYNVIAPGKRPQPSALKHAQDDPVVRSSDWVLVFDADEFLCIRQGNGTLDSLLTATKDAGANGVVITWRIFGSDGVQNWSTAPVTEQYRSAAPPMWNKGWGVKTLFKHDPDYWKLGIHRPKIKNKHLQGGFPDSVKWLNGSGRPMEEYFKFRGWRSIVRTVGYDWVQMNHYAIKSMDSYAIRKLRGNVNNKADKYNAAYWALQDRNEVYDDAAHAHKTRRQKIFDTLLTDPVLAGLHMQAIAQTEARLAAFKATPDYAALVTDLKTASQVPIAEVDATPRQPRDPNKIAQKMSQIKRIGAADTAIASSNKSDSSDAHPYMRINIDLSENLPIKWFENSSINLPADGRIFQDHALQTLIEGKFMRNAGRCLPRLINPDDRYLEIGAGVGFLSAVLALEMPKLPIMAQEEVATLLYMADVIWRKNRLVPSPHRRLTQTPLFDPFDAQHEASGLLQLIQETSCSVLYANDPRLTDRMFASAIASAQVTLPRLIVIGARPLAAGCDLETLTDLLADHAYRPAADQTLTNSLILQRSPS